MYQKSSPESIQAMFASIAENYDKANTTFSFGFHKKWNLKLTELMGSAGCLLDLCAGTGEIAFTFLKKNPQAEAILLDFCPEMLEVAQKKGQHFHERFEIIKGDAVAIPLTPKSVDAVTIAYGIRNVKDPKNCFHEVYRVLRNEGKFGILELTRPRSTSLKFLHQLYLRLFLPILGKIAAKNKEAYKYLVNSIESFTAPEELEESLRQCGFKVLKRKRLMGGIATILISQKV